MTGVAPFAANAFGDDGSLITAIETAAASGPGFYLRMRRTVTRLLAKFRTGEVKLLVATLTETDDVLAAEAISEQPIPRNCYVGGFSEKFIDGARIIAGDVRIVMDAAGLSKAPTNEDQVRIDGARHQIVAVHPIPAAGDVCVYIIQARTSGAAQAAA